MKVQLHLFLLASASVAHAGIFQDGLSLAQSCSSAKQKTMTSTQRRTLANSQEEACSAEELLAFEQGQLAGKQATEQVYESSYKEVTSPAVQAKEVDRFGSDFGEAQVIDGQSDEDSNRMVEQIQKTREYMNTVVAVEEQYSGVKDICRNKDSMCTYWAILGECDANPAYMKVNCAPACQSCEQLDISVRCPMDPDAKDALYPGDLDKMFTRIVTDPYYQQFEPVVLSRPSYVNGDTAENATYKIGIWMVMFENALSSEEADRLIELGGFLGYKRSADVGIRQADGTYTDDINEGRTSTNAWCTDACYEDPVAKRIMARIENITGIPEANSENLQLLRYEKDQFYQTHNDYIPYQLERPTGVRILTYYMYLEDVEEGGGTNFPNNGGGMTVTPKKGRAVLWPSVFDERPNQPDARSAHQALPVIKGVKYGANAWIHQRDFKGPNSRGC